YRAAARGNDAAAQMGERLEHAGLQFAKMLLALQCEDRRDVESGAFHDQRVGIDELKAKLSCHKASQRGLSAAHEADENEIGVWGGQAATWYGRKACPSMRQIWRSESKLQATNATGVGRESWVYGAAGFTAMKRSAIA